MNLEHYSVIPASARDLERALPDIISLRAGVDPVRPGNPHPLAVQYRDSHLANLAAAFGNLLDTDNPEAISKAFRSGMNSVSFSAGLEQTGRHLISRAFRQDDSVRKLCRPLPVPDFKPRNRATVQVTGLKQGTENAELPLITGHVHERVDPSLTTWTGMLLFRRETLINDDLQLVADMFTEVAEMLQRNEQRQVFTYLDSNPTLPELDGRSGSARAWFTADDGNLLTGQSLNLAGLTAAAAALRKQQGQDGHPSNIQPAYLITPVEQEMPARALIHDNGLPLEIMVSPFIGETRFYLAANHLERPAIGLQFLGDPGDQIRTWSISAARKLPPVIEGIGHHVNQDLRPVAISRRGLVRVET